MTTGVSVSVVGVKVLVAAVGVVPLVQRSGLGSYEDRAGTEPAGELSSRAVSVVPRIETRQGKGKQTLTPDSATNLQKLLAQKPLLLVQETLIMSDDL